MKNTHVSIAFLLSIVLSTFAAAQMHMMGHSKMHMKPDTAVAKDTSKASLHEKYSCPIHPEVVSEKPGQCSKCGMDLVKSETTKMESAPAMYVCPMHPDVKSATPGKCPKCGMKLQKSKAHTNTKHDDK